MRVNGVDVVPLVEAELNRRYPDRARCARPMRTGSASLGHPRAAVAADGRAGPPDGPGTAVPTGRRRVVLHRELRHLVFATDAWEKRAILGEPSPWAAGPAPRRVPDDPSVRATGGAASMDGMLALRADRMATVRRVLADLTDDHAAGVTEPVTERATPSPKLRRPPLPAGRPQRGVEHRLYAERDFDVLDGHPRLRSWPSSPATSASQPGICLQFRG